jgi:3-hydroxybutyrate dehydrogenase
MLKKQAVKEFIPIEAIAEMALLWLRTRNDNYRLDFTLDGGWSAQYFGLVLN